MRTAHEHAARRHGLRSPARLALAGLAAACLALAASPDGASARSFATAWDDHALPNVWVPVAPQVRADRESGGRLPTVRLHGLFTTMALFRSDSDFDRTPPYYDPDGQTEGQVATFFRPDITIAALKGRLAVFYQVEVGWNAWSLNDPDLSFPADEAYPVLKHREIRADWRFDETLRLRLGYQRYRDSSGLFLNHWGGAVALDIAWDDLAFESGTRVIVGQLPDETFEGIDVRDNNFVHDNVFVGVANRWRFFEGASLDADAYFLADFRTVDRPLYLGTVVLGARQDAYTFSGWAHVVAQYGVWEGAAAAGEDATILSWAAQVGARLRLGGWTLTGNALFLSPDDDHEGNGHHGAFLGSSKNRSRTLYLTEDEFRDRYDNLDERLASSWGPFFVNRAGLFIGELTVGYEVAPWYRPALVLAAATKLNPANAMDHAWVGLEADLVNVFPLADGVALFAIGQLFVPGAGAAVFVNDIDRTATDIVGGVELGFTAQF